MDVKGGRGNSSFGSFLGHAHEAKEAPTDHDRLNRVLSLVILFLLATTLFNTLRANRVEDTTTSFRKQARCELKVTKRALEEQKKINERLEQELNLLLAEQAEGSAGD